MTKQTETGFMRTVSWIPVEFAVVGKKVKLKIGNEWDEGWVVETANGTPSEPPKRIRFDSLEKGSHD